MQESFCGRDFFFQGQKEDTNCLEPLPPNLTQRVGKGD